MSFLFVLAMTVSHAMDPQTDLSRILPEAAARGLGACGIFKLEDLKRFYAERGILWHRGLPRLPNQAVGSIQRSETFAFVREGTRLDPRLKPIDLLNLPVSAQWALHFEGLWNLGEIKTRYLEIARAGFLRFDKMGSAGVDRIEALLTCANHVDAP